MADRVTDSLAPVVWTDAERAYYALTGRVPVAVYTARQVQQLLGLGRTTLYDAVGRGEFPTPVLRLGGRLLFPKAPLDRLLAGAPQATDAPTAAGRVHAACWLAAGARMAATAPGAGRRGPFGRGAAVDR